jgi:hypothetical protein
MKTNGKVEVRLLLHVFSTVALDGHDWSALCSHRLIPGKITVDIHSTAKMNAGKEKNLLFLSEMESRFISCPAFSWIII